jgi:hypothetical protein
MMERKIGFRGVSVGELTRPAFAFMIETDRSIAAGRLLAITSLMPDVHTVVKSASVIEFFPAMWAFSTTARAQDVFVRLALAIDVPVNGGYSPFNDGTQNASYTMSTVAKIHLGCFINECLGVDLERDLFLEMDEINGFGKPVPYQALYRGLADISGLSNDLELNQFAGLMNGTYGNFRETLGSASRKNYLVPYEATRFRCPDFNNPLMGWIRNVWAGFDSVRIANGVVSWPISFLIPLPVLMRQCGYTSCPMILPRACRLTLNPSALRLYMPGLKLATFIANVPVTVASAVGSTVNKRWLTSRNVGLSIRTAPVGGDEPVLLDLANLLTRAFISSWSTTPLTTARSDLFTPLTRQGITIWTRYMINVLWNRGNDICPILRFMDYQFGDVGNGAESPMTVIEIGLTGDRWRLEAAERFQDIARDGITRKCGAFSLVDHGNFKKTTSIRGQAVSLLGVPRYERLAIGLIPEQIMRSLADPTSRFDETLTGSIFSNIPYLYDYNAANPAISTRTPLVVTAMFESYVARSLPALFYAAISNYFNDFTVFPIDLGGAARGGYTRHFFGRSDTALGFNEWNTASESIPTIVNSHKPPAVFEYIDLDDMLAGGSERVKLYRGSRTPSDCQVASQFFGFRVDQYNRMFKHQPMFPKGDARYWFMENVFQNYDTRTGGNGLRHPAVRSWWIVDMVGTERQDLPSVLPHRGVHLGSLTYRLTDATPTLYDEVRLVTVSFGRVSSVVNDTAMVSFSEPNGVSSVTNCLFNCV